MSPLSPSFTVPTVLPAVICFPSPLSHASPSLFLLSSPFAFPHILLCLCMSVCVLWAASQDDGEVRAALGTGSQWRGLRPWGTLAAISQGSAVIASPDGLQVTFGKRIDGAIIYHLFHTVSRGELSKKKHTGKKKKGRVAGLCFEKGEEQTERKICCGILAFPRWLVLINIYIGIFVQLPTPTRSLTSASQTVVRGIWGFLRVGVCLCVSVFLCSHAYRRDFQTSFYDFSWQNQYLHILC